MTDQSTDTHTYDPSIFSRVGTIQDAKNLILTPEIGLSPDQRWERETPYLMRLMAQQWAIDKDDLVLDYGCGIGRLSKALIDKYGCRVLGVDISANMRALAASYVASERFIAVHPKMLSLFSPDICDFALSVWVLQHCHPLVHALEDIERLVNGPLFVVNEKKHRCLPIQTGGWLDDGVDVYSELQERFTLLADGQMDPDVVTKAVTDRTFWALYRCC